MRVLIVGCGYVGLPLGAELAGQGHEVFGLRRSNAAQTQLEAARIKPLLADITKPAELARLTAGYEWVVNCVASGGGGAGDYQRVYLQGTRNVLDWLASTPPERFVYTSSTSVYGQNDGSVVDESSPTEPLAETAKVLLETERQLLAAARQQGFAAVILRLAGIYGPGRGHWYQQFQTGRARLEGKGERWLNMIHRDDVVGCILAALQHGCPGQIYNAVDDEPVSRSAFFKWLSIRLGKPMPPSHPEVADSRKRGVTNKKVSNQKLKRELGYRFKHPTFREGYGGRLRAEG